MEKVTSTSQLKSLIFSLEQQQKVDEKLLKEQMLIVAAALKPANIIKAT